MTIVNCKTNYGIPPKSDKPCTGKINLEWGCEVTYHSSAFRKSNNAIWHYYCSVCDEYSSFTPDEVRKLKENKKSTP